MYILFLYIGSVDTASIVHRWVDSSISFVFVFPGDTFYVCLYIYWYEMMSVIAIIDYISLISYCYSVFFLNTYYIFVWFEHGSYIIYIYSDVTMLALWNLMINHERYIHIICFFELMILVILFRPLSKTPY
jgi:hypothetical protein